MQKIYKYLLIVLFGLISLSANAQLNSNGLKLTNPGYIIGPKGDTIYNVSPGVWSFQNDTLKNVVIQGLETISSISNTYFVSPTFPNSGKYYSTIQRAIDSISGANDSTYKTIIVFSGIYAGFTCSKSYVNIIGIGLPLITDNSYSFVNLTGTNILFKGFKIYRKNHVIENSYFRVINLTGSSITLDNIDVNLAWFNNIYSSSPTFSIIRAASSVDSFSVINSNLQVSKIDEYESVTSTNYGISIEGSTSKFYSKDNNIKLEFSNGTVDPVGTILNIYGIYFNTSNTTKFKRKILSTNIYLNAEDDFTSVNKYSVKDVSGASTNTLLINVISNSDIGLTGIYIGVLIDPDFTL